MRNKLFLSIAAAIFIMLILETSARVIKNNCTAENVYGFHKVPFQKSSLLGWELKPLAKGHWYGNFIEVNSLGFRGREVPAKTEDSFRVFCLGDSLVFGHGVEYQDSFPCKLQEYLSLLAKKQKIEVINGGIPGYATWQERILLENKVAMLKPDLLVLTFCLNDITSQASYKCGSALHKIRILLEKNCVLFEFLDNFIYYKIKRPILVYRHKKEQKVEKNIKNSGELAKLAKFPEFIVLIDKNSTLRERWWRQTQDELKGIISNARKNRINIIMAAVPFRYQLYQAESDIIPQKLIREFCYQSNVPFIDLLPVFKKYNNKRIFLDLAHMSPLGNRIISKELTRFIIKANYMNN